MNESRMMPRGLGWAGWVVCPLGGFSNIISRLVLHTPYGAMYPRRQDVQGPAELEFCPCCPPGAGEKDTECTHSPCSVRSLRHEEQK